MKIYTCMRILRLVTKEEKVVIGTNQKERERG